MVKFNKSFDEIEFSHIVEYLDKIEYKENIFVEFKSYNAFLENDKNNGDYINHQDVIASDITPFLNSFGGYLFYGVDEKNRKINGLSKEKLGIYYEETVKQKLTGIIETKIMPNITGIRIKILDKPSSDRFVCVLDIPEGQQKWYTAEYKGYLVHVSRNDNGKTIMDRDSIKWGYIATESANEQIEKFIKERIDENIAPEWVEINGNLKPQLEKSIFLLFCIPTDFRSLVHDIGIHRNDKIAQQLKSNNGEPPASYFEIDNFHCHSKLRSGNFFETRVFTNGIIEITIDLIEHNKEKDNFTLDNALYFALFYAKLFGRVGINYITTIKLLLKKGFQYSQYPTINRFGLIRRFAKPIISLEKIDFSGLTRVSQNEDLKILFNQLGYFQNMKVI